MGFVLIKAKKSGYAVFHLYRQRRCDCDPLRRPQRRPRHQRNAYFYHSAVMGKGLGKDVAVITDSRFFGGSHSFVVGHIMPAAYAGGALAVTENSA